VSRAATVLLMFALCGNAAVNGNAACESCHRKQTASQAQTGMARALQSGRDSDVLKSYPRLTYRQDKFSYTIERNGDASFYRVTDGKDEVRAPISWAFGLGAAGQTYLFFRNGAWYESRVSFYKDISNLDLTVGARPEVPRTLDEAAGRELSTRGADECFNCHAAGALVGGKLHTESLTPGVQCDRCHEGVQQHLSSVQGHVAAAVPPRLKALSTEEMSDFCGQCHRTWAQIASQGPRNISNVRFQPYRLTNSRCYDSSDGRIRCTACHDPHTEVSHASTSYDARCTACHSAGAKAGAKLCKVARKDCVTCHMPKIAIAEAHNKFTDHWIRVVRQGQPDPN
jgi:hypothetical protein